ncbi:MAG TPA: hypothetical protein VGN72_10160 [Tepidisphaeraceae bacterium]|jgi:hypothetical protein|nr:hypothetical protein [Tepidisphaeraceae bacterium]
MKLDESRVVTLMHRWARWAERWWYAVPGNPALGCFGTGYDWWGVQTNAKYVAAMAVLSTRAELSNADRDWARQRALAALRFCIASHMSGPLACTDGRQWGQTWISGLGIERMMHGVAAIDEHLTAADRAGLQRMLESECDWLLTDYRRGSNVGIKIDKWNDSGKNDPESNLWNGAILWRTAAMYPDHPHAARWREHGLAFLAAGVSIAADANDDTVYDGLPLKQRHVGAGFFDSYALDHHGYFNVGYMAICVSNAAILHFDLKRLNLPAPQLLHLHQRDLWRTLRPLIFTDGRLVRMGGDTRVRYAYCQEYLVPSLLYAADHLGDAIAVELMDGYLSLCETEAAYNGDGSFYGRRLAALANHNPYYYVRLEGDRINALSMALAYAPLVRPKKKVEADPSPTVLWSDREYGAAMHRSPTRLASFAWRAKGLTQGLCVPPDRSDLAEWEQNLAGEITFVHDPHSGNKLRRLVRHDVREMPGGFITSGTIVEGAQLFIAEGWTGKDLGLHYLAFVALPDDRTVVGIQVCRAAALRALVRNVKGLRLNVPNDLFNNFTRQLDIAGGTVQLNAAANNEVVSLDSRWATIDGRLSVVGLYGAPTLTLDRSTAQRGGATPNLTVEQLCFGHRSEVAPFFVEPNAVLLDCAWMVSTTDAAATRQLADRNATARVETNNDALRAVAVHDTAGKRHVIVLNASESSVTADVMGKTITLPAGEATHWAV